MRPHHHPTRHFNLPAWIPAIVMLTFHGAAATPIIGDTIIGDLTVTGCGQFTSGVDLGPNGELSFNWLPADLSNPAGTATFDIAQAPAAFLWRDTVLPTPAARNKMQLDPSNALILYKSDGTEGLLLDPENGKITVLAAGSNSGIFFGTNTLPTLKAAANGAAIFTAPVTMQSGLQLTGGLLQVSTTTPATSSATGALIVAGGLGVGLDAYFNGVRVGKGAGNGSSNTVCGAGSLGVNTTGYSNTASGTCALRANTSGYFNTASGAYALFANTTGFYNTAAGPYALYANTTGSYNTASGPYALNANTTGYSNTASGAYALYANTTGGYNNALGVQSLRSNTTGYYNTASGTYALYANTTGYYNTASGNYSLYANTTGGYNTASGVYSLRANTTGSYNTASGTYALYANTTGTGNTAVGYQASYPNTFGSSNVSVGSYAAYYQANGSTLLTDPESSIYIGANVRGKDNNDSNSIVIGARSIGEGANTTVIGNSATTKTHLYGELVASTATVGGYPVLATKSGTNAVLTNSASLALGNYASATQQGAIAIGQGSQATMNLALALGCSATASNNCATAIQQASATGTYAFAASLGHAGGDYSLGMAGGQAYGASSVAIGGFDEAVVDANYALGIGSVAIGGQMNAALGTCSYAMGCKVVSPGAYGFAIGSRNLSSSNSITPGSDTDWLEESALLEVGNGNPDATSLETSNAITTLKNGQTTLTNKAWKANASAPLADPEPTTDSGGYALVVEGHTVLKGKVVIEQPQGDISMGIYGAN